ncbi:unnamed protein product [Sympodiomycopsis kandeliae]
MEQKSRRNIGSGTGQSDVPTTTSSLSRCQSSQAKMADEVKIDKELFATRLNRILNLWKSKDANNDAVKTFQETDALLAVLGAQSDDVVYHKTAALHIWLLGYEFPSTVILLNRDGITFVSSASKAKYLEGLDGTKGVKVNVLKRGKDDAQNKQIWQDVVDTMSASGNGKKIGRFAKDQAVGKVAEEWTAFYDEVKTKKGFEEVDVGAAMGVAWGPKNDEELANIKLAGRMASSAMSKYFVDELAVVLDENKKTTHERLAAKVEGLLDNDAFWKKIKNLGEADMTQADWAYTPIIQSGGDYDLRPSAQSNDKRLAGADGGGVIVASMGMKYKSYNANVGRTYLVDPQKSQEKVFTFLCELQTEIITNHLRPGKAGKDVYESARKYIQDKKPDLAEHFVKNAGFAIGLEFRDAAYVLGPKCQLEIQQDMAVNLSLGFSGLPDPNRKGSTYAVSLIDTLKVNDGPATFLTDRLKNPSESFFYQDKESEDEEVKEPSPKKNVTAGGKVLRNKGQNQMDANVANKIKQHQHELAVTKQEEGLRKYAGEEGEGGVDQGATFKKFESYKRGESIPAKSQDMKVFVDARASSIILPIYGFAVPFHINTLKNISKSDEGAYTYLRFNFISPGQIAGKKDDTPFEDPDATFVRSMTFRSTDNYHYAELYKEITEMKKLAAKKEAEKKELSDVVEQDKLILNKSRPPVLREVFPRPALEGKRVPGDLEIHQNGLRFSSPLKDQKVDVLFNNVKHIFFQPCDKELIVLIHFHLKSPIIIGKKKTKDIQFYREASDVQFDETGNRKRKYRAGDEDELELEQEERRHRAHLNKEFKKFAEMVAEVSDDLTVDVPYRELGFDGVPFRTNVWLSPTNDCLVHLTDSPFTVMTLAEVEIAHLERVQYGLKNFDLVFVFKDYTRPPLHINSIPTQSLDNVKEWLDSVDILVSEGPVNLQWSQILRTIQDDPYEFFNNGGWSFLQSSDGDSDSDESESGSAYTESDAFEEISSDEDSDDAGSDFDGSDASDDDEDGSEGDDSEEEEGMDWDELEKKAAKADKKKGDHSDDEDDRKKSKKSKR